MYLHYNLILQTAVNQMVQDLWEKAALVLIDIGHTGQLPSQTICLDHSILKELSYTQKGFDVTLYLPFSKPGLKIQMEICYHDIDQIVCYYDELGYQQTLYCKPIRTVC